jgi:hypothetical protein
VAKNRLVIKCLFIVWRETLALENTATCLWCLRNFVEKNRIIMLQILLRTSHRVFVFLKLLQLVRSRHSKLIQLHQKMTHDLLDGQFGTAFLSGSYRGRFKYRDFSAEDKRVHRRDDHFLSLKWEVLKPPCNKIKR